MKHWTTSCRLALAAATLVGTLACQSAPPASPTTSAQVAATAIATVAVPIAETAVAVAAPIATEIATRAPAIVTTQVAAAETQVAAVVPTVAIASPIPGSPIRITDVQFGVLDTTITIQDISGAALDLTGWKLSVGTASATLPAGTKVDPNATLIIHTRIGTNTARDVFLGAEALSLLPGLRPGAVGALLDRQGTRVGEFRLPS